MLELKRSRRKGNPLVLRTVCMASFPYSSSAIEGYALATSKWQVSPQKMLGRHVPPWRKEWRTCVLDAQVSSTLRFQGIWATRATVHFLSSLPSGSSVLTSQDAKLQISDANPYYPSVRVGMRPFPQTFWSNYVHSNWKEERTSNSL